MMIDEANRRSLVVQLTNNSLSLRLLSISLPLFYVNCDVTLIFSRYTFMPSSLRSPVLALVKFRHVLSLLLYLFIYFYRHAFSDVFSKRA